MKSWGGNRAKRLVQFTLTHKGRICHLCGLGGANSADHDPPRSVLIANGVQDPDAMRFLFPAHLSCNLDRKARPITDALRTELRDRMLARHRVTAAPSARFARSRAS